EYVPRARNLSITIRVDHLATPADSSLLGLDLVLRLAIDLIIDLRIHPADYRTAELVEIYGLVGIVIELKVMSRETGVDQIPSLRLGIIERRLASAGAQRIPVGIFVGRIIAPRGVLIRPDLGGCPHAAFAVEHRIVRIGGIIGWISPQMLVAPVQRRH